MTAFDLFEARAAAAPISAGAGGERLAERFRPIFARIAEGALERERNRVLPHEPIAWLKAAGFGAVRVPVEYGGAGASLPELISLLIELGEADSNLPQALRGHFAFVEDRLNAAPGPGRETWFRRFVAGEIVGNAWTEVGSVALGDLTTRVSRDGERWVVNGEKYYSTGSIFADWIDVLARRADDGRDVVALVRTRQSGVTIGDDWDGFGQRTTGSGTATFSDAEVQEHDIIDFSSRFKYQTAFYQLVLLAVLAGVGRAALRDVSREVRERRRVYSHGNGPSAAGDAQVQQVVGKIGASVFAAQATAVEAARAAQRAYEARFGDNEHAEQEANIAAELDSARGQIAVADLVLRACAELFNALGASGTSESKGLDRHWRNARTAASHNPLIYKERIVGDWEINGTEPPYLWQIGNGPAVQGRTQG
ncbi:acyl-CoA dehydrogenase family protein [Trinickia diaoshuihuensis]|uniref:acyl-CoA dehydrogenase family protein n=1 Tax=Trinickia diaoshuihuensis TaxID=2292265 RepID=UPI000E232BD0|nr:acyl-CoA dehydrogenase family protein [Trinickia diaoshuihuensis]